jgi:hypothetical protein
MTKGINTERLEPLIFRIRGHRVVLDSDLARLYGVPTVRFNQAFKRNRHRFAGEGLDSSGPNSSQFVMSSSRRRGMIYRPWAFTEHGVLMAANVLRSDQAVQMSVFLVRAFVRLREQVAANTAILKRLAEIDKALIEHDTALSDLYRKLRPLLEPPAEPPARPIGFHTEID